MPINYPDMIGVQLRRFLWHVNRSPLAPLVKWGVRVVHNAEVTYRRRLAKTLPRDERLDNLAHHLATEGYARCDSVMDAALLNALSVAGNAKLARACEAAAAQRLTHKPFWSRLLDEDMRDGGLPAESPFVRFALQPSVIGILCRLLGAVPRLDYVLLTLSRNSGDQYSYSQLWHRDHDDIRTVKLFVYLTDVNDQQDGPFTFLPGPVSDRFGFSLHSHQADNRILAKTKPDEIISMIAPRLSTFMVETSRCLHMGSRVAPSCQRLLYTATFFAAPRMYPEPAPCFRLRGDEDEMSRSLLLPMSHKSLCASVL